MSAPTKVAELALCAANLRKHIALLEADGEDDGRGAKVDRKSDADGVGDGAGRRRTRRKTTRLVTAEARFSGTRRQPVVSATEWAARGLSPRKEGADVADSDGSSSDSDFLHFQDEDLQQFDEGLDLASSKATIQELLSSIRVKGRVETTKEISEWFTEALSMGERMEPVLDNKDEEMRHSRRDVESAHEHLSTMLENRGRRVVSYMRRFHQRMVDVIPAPQVPDRRPVFGKGDRGFRSGGPDTTSATESAGDESHRPGSPSSLKSEEEDNGPQHAGAMQRADMLHQMLTDDEKANKKRIAPKRKNSTSAHLATKLLDIISQQQEEIAHLRSRSDLGGKRVETLKGVLEHLRRVALDEPGGAHDSPDARRSRFGQRFQMSEAVQETLRDMIHELQTNYVVELLSTKEGRRQIETAAKESGSTTLSSISKVAENQEEATRLQRDVAALEKELRRTTTPAQRIDQLKKELEAAKRKVAAERRQLPRWAASAGDELGPLVSTFVRSDSRRVALKDSAAAKYAWLWDASEKTKRDLEAARTDMATSVDELGQVKNMFLSFLRDSKKRYVKKVWLESKGLEHFGDSDNEGAEKLRKDVQAKTLELEELKVDQHELEEDLVHLQAAIDENVRQKRMAQEAQLLAKKKGKKAVAKKKAVSKNAGQESKGASEHEAALQAHALFSDITMVRQGNRRLERQVVELQAELEQGDRRHPCPDVQQSAGNFSAPDNRASFSGSATDFARAGTMTPTPLPRNAAADFGFVVGDRSPSPMVAARSNLTRPPSQLEASYDDGDSFDFDGGAALSRALSLTGSVFSRGVSLEPESLVGIVMGRASRASDVRARSSSRLSVGHVLSVTSGLSMQAGVVMGTVVSESSRGGGVVGSVIPEAATPRASIIRASVVRGASPTGAIAFDSSGRQIVKVGRPSSHAMPPLGGEGSLDEEGAQRRKSASPGLSNADASASGAAEDSLSATMPSFPPSPVSMGYVASESPAVRTDFRGSRRAFGVVVCHDSAALVAAASKTASVADTLAAPSKESSAAPATNRASMVSNVGQATNVQQEAEKKPDKEPGKRQSVAKVDHSMEEVQIKQLIQMELDRRRFRSQIDAINERIRRAKAEQSGAPVEQAPGTGAEASVNSLLPQETLAVPEQNKALRREVRRRQRELKTIRERWWEERAFLNADGLSPGQAEVAARMLLMRPPDKVYEVTPSESASEEFASTSDSETGMDPQASANIDQRRRALKPYVPEAVNTPRARPNALRSTVLRTMVALSFGRQRRRPSDSEATPAGGQRLIDLTVTGISNGGGGKSPHA